MTRYVGEEFVTNQGYKVEVLEYKNCKDVLIKFLESGEEVCVTLYNLKNGSVRNRLHPSCHGVGYLGFGEEVATIGVRRNCNKFEAGVSVFGVRKYLGLFETEHSAFLAYKSGKEAVIKECALKYSDILPKEIFECLMSYEVCEED